MTVDPNNGQNVYAIATPNDFVPPGTIPAATTFPPGTLYKSTTGAGGPYASIQTNTSSYAVDGVSTNRLLAAVVTPALTPGIYESLNNGTNWNFLGGGATFVAAAAYQGKFAADASFPLVTDKGTNTYVPDTIYTASGSSINVTKDHGATWVGRPVTGFPAGGNIAALIVDPRSRDTIYVISNTFGGNKVFKSTDAGQTWLNLNANLPNVPVWAITLDPRNNNLYIGNDQGVYLAPGAGSVTTQAQANALVWSRFGQNLPQVQVRGITIDQTQDTITIATYGRSVYQLWLNSDQVNGGGLEVLAGSVVWTGPIALAGATTLNVAGNDALQNGVAAANFNVIGSIRDLYPTTANNLTKTGGGFLTLSGNNTYAGVTDITSGVVIANNPNALGSAVGNTIVENGAALWIENDLQLEPITVYGDGIPFDDHNTGAIRNISNDNTYTGPLTLATNSTIGADSGTSLTIGMKAGLLGTGTVTGAFDLVKELTGTLDLADADTYGGSPFQITVNGSGGVPATTWAGGTVVSQGDLEIANGNALGNAGNTVTVLNGAQLQIAGGITVPATETMHISGTGIFNTPPSRTSPAPTTGKARSSSPRTPASTRPSPPPPSSTSAPSWPPSPIS